MKPEKGIKDAEDSHVSFLECHTCGQVTVVYDLDAMVEPPCDCP